ncbi:MAG: hypothetical protein VCD00_03440 [Candidatus Hydrogenedentota bacterium]
MKKYAIRTTLLGLGMTLATTAAMAHPGHGQEASAPSPELLLALQDANASGTAASSGKTSGQGDLRFKVIYSTADLPAATEPGILSAHGGFAVDRRDGKGEIYWALPKVGILRIGNDLKTVDVLPTDRKMKPTNMHNATIWYGKKDQAYLTFPGNDSARIYTTDLDGTLLNILESPTAETKFDENRVSKYFADGKKFIPTDVEVVNNKFYITTGYSPLDYVLTANVKAKKDVTSEWASMAFGGKGSRPGQFGTGHGITIKPDGKTIAVADRPNAEIEEFDLKGNYLNTLNLPEGAFPCDIDYQSGYTIVGCLHGKDREAGAPIYIVKDGEVVSTIMIKSELGLADFQHVHNAVMIERNGKFYVITQAWNPGGFAILEQVK